MKPNQRHRTAISRTTLSRPLRLALEAGLIDNAHPVLDYDCGRGDDVRELQARGIACEGWDPVHRPEGKRQATAVVNLGYVANVIEDPAERSGTLRQAWQLAQQGIYRLLTCAITTIAIRIRRLFCIARRRSCRPSTRQGSSSSG